jgi:hypothetical protein
VALLDHAFRGLHEADALHGQLETGDASPMDTEIHAMHPNPPAEHGMLPTDLNAHTTGSRTITIVFRRDPSRDRREEQVQYQGYQLLWQDGHPVALGLDGFCRRGQRLLGLDHHLGNRPEARIQLQCVPLPQLEAPLTRLPGCRVRRFLLKRAGLEGRLHFLNGSPTAAAFHLDRDEPRVLDWIGLPSLADGACQWVDLAARVVEADSSTSTALSDEETPGGHSDSGVPSLPLKGDNAPETLRPGVHPIP